MDDWYETKAPGGITQDKLVWRYNNIMKIDPEKTPLTVPLMLNDTIINHYNLLQDTIDVVFSSSG